MATSKCKCETAQKQRQKKQRWKKTRKDAQQKKNMQSTSNRRAKKEQERIIIIKKNCIYYVSTRTFNVMFICFFLGTNVDDGRQCVSMSKNSGRM